MASEIFGIIYKKILTKDQKQLIERGKKYVVKFELYDPESFKRELTTVVTQVDRGKFEVTSMIMKMYANNLNGEEEIESIDSITEVGSFELKNFLENWDNDMMDLLNFDVTPYEMYVNRPPTPPIKHFIHCSPSGYTII